MKKLVIALVLCLALTSFCFATQESDNYQKIYSVDDTIWQKIADLYLLTGRSLPSTTGPYSGSELKAMIEKIDASTLSGYQKQLYDNIMNILDSDAAQPVFKAQLEVNAEAYINSNSSSQYFQTRDNWIRGWANQRQFLNINTEEHVGANFYGFFDFSLGTAKDWESNGSRDRKFGDSVLWTNIPFVLANDMKQLDFNFPLRAFVSAGGDNWTFTIGRDKLSWGNGKTGNFVIGDHIKYHNAAHFTTFEKNFKYTFLVSAFPHPQMYYKEITDSEGNVTGMELSLTGLSIDGQSDYMNGISAFIAHRLEWNILDNLSMTLTEGVIYMSKDNKIDLIAFAPAMMYHNNYTRSNTNSILSLELDWTIIKGLNVYGQLVVDESVLPGENNPATSVGLAEPDGLGYLLGATYVTELSNGILTVNAEGAYTTPYLYLRDGDHQAGETEREQTKGRYGINYVVALREMSNCGGTENYNLDFLGYKYGGDAIVAYLSAEYKTLDKWSAGLSFFYMLHGTHDKYTTWTRVNKDTNKVTPTTDHQTANYNDPNANLRDSVSTSFVGSLFGTYNFGYGFAVEVETDLIYLKNPGNISTNPSEFDCQTTISVSYTLN